MNVSVAGEEFVLYPHRGAYWKQQNALLVADLHLGKVNHFRRSGIPVPARANDRNIESLVDLIHLVKPQRLICLGDLFHSHYNAEWEVFGEVVKHFPSVSFELVLGNHDIMSELQYKRKGINVYDRLRIGSVLLTHHPEEEIVTSVYNLAGHVHPAVRLKGKGRQALTLPCFYFGAHQGFLPAFGAFTGIARIQPEKDGKVFVIANGRVMRV